MGLSVWRETSKKLTVYRVCYTPIETLTTARAIRHNLEDKTETKYWNKKELAINIIYGNIK